MVWYTRLTCTIYWLEKTSEKWARVKIRDMVNHELWVTSYELQVKSYELRVKGLKARVESLKAQAEI